MRSDSKTWEKLYLLLAEDDCDQTVYGYRVDSLGRVVKPYLFCWYMHDGLLESIRSKYGPGEYRLLIRKGRTMVFGGYICLAGPPRNRQL